MKILLGPLLFLLLAGCSNSPTAPSAPKTPDPKQTMREELIQKSRPEIEKGGGTIELKGENKDTITLTSSRLTNDEMLKLFGDTDFRTLGFTKLILIDKNNQRRELDLK